MGILSIITATYNRKKTLIRLYESLCSQTKKDFEWIIVDDGSIDNTKELLENWEKEKKIEIKYIVQRNQGKPKSINEAVKIAKNDLSVIVDSDDILVDNAVEEIINDWEKYKDYENICGLSYLKGDLTGKNIGKDYKEESFISNHIKYRINQNDKVDKAEVFKTNILKEYPFPIIEGEKFISECIVWNRIALKYETVYINKVIYLCEYQKDGLSNNWRKINIQNPKGAMLVSKEMTEKPFSKKVQIKNLILYNIYGFFAKSTWKELKNKTTHKILQNILIIPSFIMYKYYKGKYGECIKNEN